MKYTLKKIIPTPLILFRRKIIANMKLRELYKFDQSRHKKYAYELNDNWTLNNLRAKITIHYHSIEKGLSNPNVRLGFGENAFKGLFFAMDKFIDLGFNTDDSRFQHAISIIESYVEFHEDKSFRVEWIKNQLQVYSRYATQNYNNVGGYGVLKEKDLPNYGQLNFKDLAKNRHSIRDFGRGKVDSNKVDESIQIATKTPSVCNRQAYKVYRIKSENKLKLAFKLQDGLTTNGENLQELLLVTCNREFMNGPHERNQTYIDGGMYLMSLVYALTYHQIATCVLNTNFTIEKEREMRKILEIPFSEDLISFVAIGTFKNENKYAKSPRDEFNNISNEL